jgi:hypothetical protein
VFSPSSRKLEKLISDTYPQPPSFEGRGSRYGRGSTF